MPRSPKTPEPVTITILAPNADGQGWHEATQYEINLAEARMALALSRARQASELTVPELIIPELTNCDAAEEAA